MVLGLFLFLIMNHVCAIADCHGIYSQMTVEELDANERRAFLVWRRNLARLV